jgi:hypothetical protein
MDLNVDDEKFVAMRSLQRADASLVRLSELNRLVKTSTVTEPLMDMPEKILQEFSLVILCDGTVEEQLRVGRRLRRLGVKYMAACLHGLFASMFVDLGASYKFTTE